MLDRIKHCFKSQTIQIIKLFGVDPHSDFFKFLKDFSPFLFFMIVSDTLALLAVAMLLPLGYSIISMPALVILISIGFILQVLFHDILQKLSHRYGYIMLLKIALSILILTSFIMLAELNSFLFVLILILVSLGSLLLYNCNQGYYDLYVPSQYLSKLNIFKYICIAFSFLIFLGIANMPSFIVGLIFMVISVFAFMLLVLLPAGDEEAPVLPQANFLSHIQESIRQINFSNYLQSGLGSRIATVYFVLAVSMQSIGIGTEINKLSVFINFMLVLIATAWFMIYSKKQSIDYTDKAGLIFGIIISILVSGFVYYFSSVFGVIVAGIIMLVTNIVLSRGQNK